MPPFKPTWAMYRLSLQLQEHIWLFHGAVWPWTSAVSLAGIKCSLCGYYLWNYFCLSVLMKAVSLLEKEDISLFRTICNISRIHFFMLWVGCIVNSFDLNLPPIFPSSAYLQPTCLPTYTFPTQKWMHPHQELNLLDWTASWFVTPFLRLWLAGACKGLLTLQFPHPLDCLHSPWEITVRHSS